MIRTCLPGPVPAGTLSCMASATRGTVQRRAARLAAWPLAAALLLTGCPAAGPEADQPGHRTTPAATPPVAPPTAVAAASTPGAVVTAVDLSPPGGRTEVPLDVAAAPDGGASVLVGRPPLGPPTRLLTVTARGEVSGSVPVRQLTAAWDLRPLDDGTVLVSGTLAREDAAGWLRIEPGGGRGAAVAAVPLAADTERVEGLTAVSDDGRTVFLYVLTTVDGRTTELVEAWDLADGELLAARDLFADVRGLAAPFTVPDPVSLVPLPDGGVALVTNVWVDGTNHLPLVLTYDSGLTPTGDPIALGSGAVDPIARVAARTAGGRVLVLLRGSPASTLVAVRPDARQPVPLVAVPGFGSTGHLALDPHGTTALLDGPTGARLVDLGAARTTTVDVGCPTVTTVTALALSTSGRRALVLGSCPAPGPTQPTLWMTG
jgi:hypothetical protein